MMTYFAEKDKISQEFGCLQNLKLYRKKEDRPKRAWLALDVSKATRYYIKYIISK